MRHDVAMLQAVETMSEGSWHRRAMATLVDRRARRADRAIGLRDLAVLALLDAGLGPSQIARLTGQSLEQSAGTDLLEIALPSPTSSIVVRVRLDGYQTRCVVAYLAEVRRFRRPEPLLDGYRDRPLTSNGIKLLARRYRRLLARRERRLD